MLTGLQAPRRAGAVVNRGQDLDPSGMHLPHVVLQAHEHPLHPIDGGGGAT